MCKRIAIFSACLALAIAHPVRAADSTHEGAGRPAAPGGAVNDANGGPKPGTGTGASGAKPDDIGDSEGRNGPGMGSGNTPANSPNNPGVDAGPATAPHPTTTTP